MIIATPVITLLFEIPNSDMSIDMSEKDQSQIYLEVHLAIFYNICSYYCCAECIMYENFGLGQIKY